MCDIYLGSTHLSFLPNMGIEPSSAEDDRHPNYLPLLTHEPLELIKLMGWCNGLLVATSHYLSRYRHNPFLDIFTTTDFALFIIKVISFVERFSSAICVFFLGELKESIVLQLQLLVLLVQLVLLVVVVVVIVTFILIVQMHRKNGLLYMHNMKLSVATKNEQWQQFENLKNLIHWGRATHICVSKLFIVGSDNGFLPGHYLSQCWDIVIWALGNKRQWNPNRNFHSRKCHQEIGGHFLSASMC